MPSLIRSLLPENSPPCRHEPPFPGVCVSCQQERYSLFLLRSGLVPQNVLVWRHTLPPGRLIYNHAPTLKIHRSPSSVPKWDCRAFKHPARECGVGREEELLCRPNGGSLCHTAHNDRHGWRSQRLGITRQGERDRLVDLGNARARLGKVLVQGCNSKGRAAVGQPRIVS